ncbi:MAG TPA: hypothetical protein VKU37_10435 [Verrucomicrobiae bacterium]|nr:hypothetical protein [Verrucomicrobiae bacterium]
MRTSFLAMAAMVALLGCSHSDPIDRLMTQVPFEDVASYLCQPVDLTSNASPEQVVAALSRRGTFQDDRITSFKILEARRVHSRQKGAESVYYSAVLMESNLGRKIVLLQPSNTGWWYKIYDAK